MWKFLIKINKNLIFAIPTLMVAGFACGVAVDPATVKKMKVLIMPMTFPKMAIPVGFGLMVLFNLELLLEDLKRAFSAGETS